MKSKLVLSLSALIILISPIFPVFIINSLPNRELYSDGLFVGITADGNVTRTKSLIDKVKSFTNFIIINNPDLMRDKNSVEEVCDYANDRAYRIHDPDFITDETAWDDVKFVELEDDDDFIQKAMAIRAGEEYDTRVSIPLDLPEDELMQLFKLAHEADMTFNDFVETVLRDHLNRLENFVGDLFLHDIQV